MKASHLTLLSLIVSLICVGRLVAEVPADGAPSPATADQLLHQALKAELEGDQQRRHQLLETGLELFPDHAGVRWHSGYVELDGQWIAVEQAEQAADEAGKLSQYRRLRDQASESFPSEVLLARWCRQQGLDEQEKYHWVNVLSKYDRNHAEARSRLGVQEVDGQLLTPEQVEIWQETKQHYREAWRRWHPRLKRWQRELARTRHPSQTAAWDELGKLNDADAIPALLVVFREAQPATQRKLAEVLGNIDDQRTTDALVRLAVFSNDVSTRRTAATQLSERSWFTFVPSLLGQLENTLELDYSVYSYGSFISTQLRYKKENEDSVVMLSDNLNSMFPEIRVVGPIESRDARFLRSALRRRNAETSRLTAQHFRRIQAAHVAVQRQNLSIETKNQRAHTALCTATGLDLDSEPQSLWNWWKDYNDYERTEEKPLVYRSQRQVTYAPEIVLGTPPGECFVTGTPVWTETGEVPIEAIRPGDRVLSQDVATGELGYRFVSQVTTRSQVETRRIGWLGHELVVTQGHPFWVVGQGWKMAKELQVGDRLRCIQDVVTVDDLQPGPEVEVFNLIVPETHSYFVGRDRVLVHDAVLRASASPPIPGWTEGASEWQRTGHRVP
jgi:hypothetical protein